MDISFVSEEVVLVGIPGTRVSIQSQPDKGYALIISFMVTPENENDKPHQFTLIMGKKLVIPQNIFVTNENLREIFDWHEDKNAVLQFALTIPDIEAVNAKLKIWQNTAVTMDQLFGSDAINQFKEVTYEEMVAYGYVG